MDTIESPRNEHVIRVTLLDAPAAHERLLNTLRRRVPGVVETSTVRGSVEGEVEVIVVVRGLEAEARTACAHLEKLIEVVSVEAFSPDGYLGVQLALLRIEAVGADQDEASDELARAGAKLLRVGPTSLVAQVADAPEVLDALVIQLKRWGTVTVLRSGLVAIGL